MSIRLDGVGRISPEVEQEQNVAIYDLLEENYFALRDSAGGPYHVILSNAEGRLVFDIRLEDLTEHGRILLSMTPFRRVLKDYQQICQSYHAAIRQPVPQRVEAVDMGRRGLHNEGAELLRERLKGKIETDFETARRLFTLIFALYLRA